MFMRREIVGWIWSSVENVSCCCCQRHETSHTSSHDPTCTHNKQHSFIFWYHQHSFSSKYSAIMHWGISSLSSK